jgi:hypothetical protein
MSSNEKVLDFPRVEGTSEENARRVMVEATRLASLAPGEWRLWIDRSAERLRIPRATLEDVIAAIIKDSEKKARDAETAARRNELAVRREQERKQREQKREQERTDKRAKHKRKGKGESIREPDQFAERAAGDQARRTGKTTRRGRCHHSRPFHSICGRAKLDCINRFMECRTLARSGRDSGTASEDQR